MRVVWLGGAFLAETAHLRRIAGQIDSLTVYGATTRLPWYPYQPAPPVGCISRAFDPRGIRRRGHLWWTYPGLSRALDSDRPNLIHVHSEPWGLLAQQALGWARRSPEVALVIHGCDRIWWHGSTPEQMARRFLARRALKRADGFLAETEEALQRAKENALPHDAITGVVHTNPRDPATFRPADSTHERELDRSALGLPVGGTGVGFVGRLVPEKGPLVFLDAIEQLHVGEDVWFAMAGTGPLEAEVKDRCRRLGVSFLGQLQNPEQTAGFFRSVDVFAVPSYTTRSWDEQSPRVVIEAMMSSCLVVGSRCGAIPEMLGSAGLVVDESDATSLALGIRRAYRMAGNQQIRNAARAQAFHRYSADTTADQLVNAWLHAQERASRSRCKPRPTGHAVGSSGTAPTILVTTSALVHNGRANLGDLAQAEETVRRLTARFPGATVSFMANTLNETYHGPTPLLRSHVEYLTRPVSAPVIRSVPTHLLAAPRAAVLIWNAKRATQGRRPRLLSLAGRNVLATLRSADALYLSGSGGFTDRYTFGVVAVWATLMLSMHRLGNPILLSGQQIGPLQSWPARLLARRALSAADLVGVRDPVSAQVAVSLGIDPQRVVLTGDDAWYLPCASEQEVDRLLESAGLTGDFIATQFRMDSSNGWSDAHVSELAAALDRLSETLGLPLVFVSMMHSLTHEGDHVANATLNRATSVPSISIEQRLRPELTKALLKRARLAVGVSNHFVVFAASAGTPAIAIHKAPYLTHKLEGLAALHPGLVTAIDWTKRSDASALLDAAGFAVTHTRATSGSSYTLRPTAAVDHLARVLGTQHQQDGATHT